jgi:hypothetical protein
MLTIDHLPSDLAATADASPLSFVPVLESFESSVLVDGDVFRIGTSGNCELRLKSGPRLHSAIHCEDGVTWIEVEDESASLLVNGCPCRRMALRDGDTLSLNEWQGVVRFLPRETSSAMADRLADDLAQLSAEELCDRILSERAAVEEFELGRRQGWQNLMAAVEAAREDELPSCVTMSVEAKEEPSADECERLLEQIRELTEMMSGRTQELDSCESDLTTAASLLQETQERVSRQIEELLDQIQVEPNPNALRASA